MNNPYSVLGVSENATDEQIKDAYRNLARKYQTSEYGANPLSDIAASKLAELDRAYDEIMMSRRGQTNYQATYSNADYTSDQSQYPDVRAKINANRIDDAETILDGIPKDVRNAEWYYLKGQIQQKRGWFDEAYKNYSSACQMDPSNIEYTNAFNSLNNNSNGGYKTSGKTGGGCSSCDLCSGLLCADCCCECFGGDIIPCC